MAERKYEMIKNAIKKELQSGALQPGEKLPSYPLAVRQVCLQQKHGDPRLPRA